MLVNFCNRKDLTVLNNRQLLFDVKGFYNVEKLVAVKGNRTFL